MTLVLYGSAPPTYTSPRCRAPCLVNSKSSAEIYGLVPAGRHQSNSSVPNISPLRRYWTKRDPGADKRWADEARAAGFPSAASWKADASLSPDITLLETQSEHRPGVTDARTDLWFDYGANLTHYPQWQQALRRTDVPVLIIWGDRDDFFTTPGALAYLRDAPHAELHILDAGHFATLQKPAEINGLMQAFLRSHHLAQ